MKYRYFTLHLLIFLAGLLLIARAFSLQVLPNEKLERRIASQFASEINLFAKRGDIYDREGKVLATSVAVWSAFVDPFMVSQRDRMVDQLSNILNINRSLLYKKISQKSRFTWIKRKLSDAEYKKLIKANLGGLHFIEEHKRVYFNQESLGPIIGKVNIDGRGLSGLELFYDKHLMGKPLKIKTLRDGKGRPLIFSNDKILDRLKGKDLHLALDVESQVFFSKTLKEQVEKVGAKRAWGLTMSAKTGELLSSVQVGEKRRSIAATEIHEPGSVLKIFSFIKAAQSQGLKPVDMVSCGQEGFKIGRRRIRNSHKEDCNEMTLVDAFAKSLNTVSAELALKTGEKRLVKFLKDLGLNRITGLDFPGEARPIFHDKLSGPHHLATVSFGQGISINAFQLLRAYSSLANEGRALNPHYKLGEAKTLHYSSKKLFSKKDRLIARGLLSAVVSKEASGAKAQIEGYLVGGKTGTSQKPDLEQGGYSKEVLASFIGIYPLSNPEYITYIVVDEPQKPRSGGSVAGPVFSKVAEFLLRKNQIFPDRIDAKNLRSLSSLPSQNKLKVLSQKQDVLDGKIPNLKGFSLREVLAFAKDAGLRLEYEGSGKVSSLNPRPGKALPRDKRLRIVLR